MHCGHYIHIDALDFDEINNHCQCPRCNTYLSGNRGIYGEKLIKMHGLEKIEELRFKSHQAHRFTREELENFIKIYSLPFDAKIVEEL